MKNAPQFIFGPFTFCLATASPEEFERDTGWKWVEQDRIGNIPALQYVGKEAETVTLKGKLVPPFTGGREQLDKLRSMANTGKPYNLITGTGIVLGQFVIERISDRTGNMLWDGRSRLTEFTLSLKKYDNATGTGSTGRIGKLLKLY